MKITNKSKSLTLLSGGLLALYFLAGCSSSNPHDASHATPSSNDRAVESFIGKPTPTTNAVGFTGSLKDENHKKQPNSKGGRK